MERQYVHLSENIEDSKSVASRRKGNIIILTVRAREAHINGIVFYREVNNIWLATSIPAKFILF